MKNIGFVISTKENEKRRAILPCYLKDIKNKNSIYIETGYGDVLGYTDDDYRNVGANVVSREEALTKEIICDPKIGDANYLKALDCNQLLFGYVHAIQNESTTDIILEKSLSAIAWEDMYEEGRHVFWRNNELAGEAAVMHAFTFCGKLPYECNVAIIGKGNVARGAYRILASLGAKIQVYNRKMEKLLRKEISEFDIIVNGILWDDTRKDHIIYREDLKKMKRNAMIIDISCDRAGGIETSIPTTIEKPTYYDENVLHYVVDHTPSLVYDTASDSFGKEIVKYLDYMLEDKIDECIVLQEAFIIKDGKIIDDRINEYQNR
jgi:N5-(carboxyethyl)ornithine synthase